MVSHVYVSISDTRLRNWFALSSRVEPLWKRQDSGQNGYYFRRTQFFGSIFIGARYRFFVEFSVADPGSDALLTPGSGMGKIQDPDPG